MQTSVTELPDSRVRIDVAVEPAEVGKRIDRAATALAGEMKMPGFRKGKVPPQMVIQRLGREAVLQQALRDSLPEWYERALLDSGVTALGSPKLDVADVPEGEDAALNFTIEIAVRPQATLGEYRGLEVGRAEPDVPGEAVDAELERLRDGFSSLEPVERAAADGDVVVADYAGTIDGEPFEGSEASDHPIELGSEGLLPEFQAGLAGAAAGDERTIEVSFPDDHKPEELAGKTASFAVTVKEVREKIAPDLDDEFASDASEFETLAELRDSISERIAEALSSRAEDEYRSAAIDAAASNATVELPEEIVRSRAEDGWERLEHSLGHRGIDPETYLKMQGKTREEAIAEAMPSAERALRAGGHPGRDRRRRGDRARRRRPARGARAGRGQGRPAQAAGTAKGDWARCHAARGGAPAEGRGPRRRGGEADPARAGRGAGEDLDAREGPAGGWCAGSGGRARRCARQALDSGRLRPAGRPTRFYKVRAR